MDEIQKDPRSEDFHFVLLHTKYKLYSSLTPLLFTKFETHKLFYTKRVSAFLTINFCLHNSSFKQLIKLCHLSKCVVNFQIRGSVKIQT